MRYSLPPAVSPPEPRFLAGFREPTDRVHVFVSGSGCLLRDREGREFLDLSSQYWNVNLGHGNPVMAQRLKEAVDRHVFVNLRFGHAEAPAKLARRLVDLFGGRFPAVLFTASGSMAVEAALKLARQATGRQEILSLRQSYHGMSYGALWCTGYDEIVLPFGPRDPRHVLAEPFRCVHCPFGGAYPSCGMKCAEAIAATVAARRGTLAAVIAEPVISNQVFVPPPEFWPIVTKACRKNNVLLIADEIVSGMGRSGAWLGGDRLGMEPDLVAFGKGLTGGYQPLGVVMHGPALAARFGREHILHGQTFDGYDLGAEAALCLIDLIEEGGLLEQVRRRGAFLQARLNALRERMPAISNVRGWGLLWGVEISPEAVPDGELHPFATTLQNALQDEGLLLGGLGRVQIFAPPFVATEAEIEDGVGRFARVLARLLGT